MLRLLFFLMTFMVFLQAKTALMVVGDKSFKDENLSLEEVKEIFLAKKRFLKGKKILVMNYEHDHSLRHCFEKNVLKKSSRSLERYWQRVYYRGKRPPKVVKSKAMLVSYMQEIQPSIGYLEKGEELPEYMVNLVELECEE